MESEHVTADVIEATEFRDLAERYSIYAVPKIVVNDRVEFEGALPEPMFVQQVLRAVEPPAGDGGGGPGTT